jgi:hypothetical protein
MHGIPTPTGFYFHVADAFLDQSTGEQATLAEWMVPVLVAKVAGFLGNVERFGGVSGKEFYGLFVEVGVGLNVLVREIVFERRRKLAGQVDAFVHAGLVHVGEKVLDPLFCVADGKRAVVGREESGSGIAPGDNDAGREHGMRLAKEML